MVLSPGSRLGPYEIVSAIGTGGMGEVYKARDTKLNREVALKVLPDLFASDPDRLARFEREAQVLASLNHPHIAHIYGLEELGAGPGGSGPVTRALVLELVEGTTLEEIIYGARGLQPPGTSPGSEDPGLRRSKGPGLALREVLAIATQIAEALEAAHEQNIIHRDLKPANVKVRDDGTVKVLDFGLAKALAPDGASAASNAMNSPTMSARATEMGMILGTAAYMSPEQAKGRAVDKRADIWAFGVVLFEMLTGRQVFGGETTSEVMASVMKDEPDWSSLPPNLPASLRRLLRRCLEKDPRRRLSSMSDVRLELGETGAEPVDLPPGAPGTSWLRLAAAAAAGVVVTALAFLFVVPLLRSTAPTDPVRLSMLAPPGVTLGFDADESAISPDGRTLVFTVVNPDGSTALWVRPLASMDAHLLAGTESGHLPFWSPDSRQIGFFTDGKLKKIPAAGGTVETLCDAMDGRGGSWGSQDVIVFAPRNAGGLVSVPASGGDPKPVTTLDAARGETGHRFPWFLPDGRHFLFVTVPAKNRQFNIFVGSLDGTRSGVLTTTGGAAVYADGYLLFPRRDVLMAQAFDTRTLGLSGVPKAIGRAPGALGQFYSAGRAVSVSTTGALAYLGDRPPDTRLVWLDRAGRGTGTISAPDGRYLDLSLSPDGRRAALARFGTGTNSDIWMVDLVRGGATRFTSAAGENAEMVWSPDGTRVVFSSDRDGARDFYIKPASGATPEELLYGSKALFKDPRSWSSDGKSLVFEDQDPKTNRDLWILPMEGDHTPRPYLRTPFTEEYGVVSPDGRWLAYLSDESGRFEVYVDSFPTPRNKYRVTDSGAGYPGPGWGNAVFWRRDGRALAMFSGDGRSLVVSDVSEGPAFSATTPRELVPLPPGVTAAVPTPDFQRVLAAVPVTGSGPSTLTVVLNWRGAIGRQ